MAKHLETLSEEEENVIIGYSERGIINSLIFAIGEDKNLLSEFIRLIKLPNSVEMPEILRYTVLLEQSFSRFGDADLVIIIHYKNKDKKVLFFEGKVKTHNKKWSIETEFKNFIDPINNENILRPKNYWSNLFSQLYLKKLLIEYSNSYEYQKVELGILEPYFGGFRKIGENKIVLKSFEKLKDCKDVCYIGLTPTLEDDIPAFSKDKGLGIHFLSWESVEAFCLKNGLKKVLNIFDYNKGQIY
jgi:hypothetical protein